MDNTQQNTNAQAANANQPTGNFIAIAIIVAVLVAGGAYALLKIQDFTYQGPSRAQLISPKRFIQDDPVLSAPESSSTDPADIERDLDMTDLDALDAEFQDLNF